MRNKGIPRKTTLAHYYSINQHLDFLTDDQRLRVLDVIQKELGNQLEKKTIKKINKLSDLLTYENIKMVDQKMSCKNLSTLVLTFYYKKILSIKTMLMRYLQELKILVSTL